MLQVLRHRDFALLWAGQLVSVLGDHLLLLALPFYVLDRTGSVLAAGATLAASAVPRALVGPIGGVIADRYPHRRVMIAADLVNASLVLALLTVGAGAPIWIVYVVVFGHAATGQVFGPTKTALIPHLVSGEQLLAANALNSTSDALTRLAGPAIGGAVFALFGLTTVVVADAVTFAVSAALLALMRSRTRSGPETSGAVQQLRDGFRAVRAHPVAPPLLVVAAIIAIASGALNVLVVPFVRNVLGRGPETLGLLASAQGVGSVIGALGTGAWGRRFTPAGLIAAAGLGTGAATFAVANTRSLVLAAASLLAAGIPSAAAVVAAQTLIQTTTEPRYIGRLAGTFTMAVGTATVLGLAVGSALADVIGTVPVMNLSGVVYLAGGIAAAILLRPRTEARPRTKVSTLGGLSHRAADVADSSQASRKG